MHFTVAGNHYKIQSRRALRQAKSYLLLFF